MASVQVVDEELGTAISEEMEKDVVTVQSVTGRMEGNKAVQMEMEVQPRG